MSPINRWSRAATLLLVVFPLGPRIAVPQSSSKSGDKKNTWQSIEFAIVRYNDSAPNTWNIYHGEKKGILLVHLWKRYLLVNVTDEEVFDIDPEKVKVKGNAVEWSMAEDKPDKPIDTPEWKERNLGMMERIRFRLGKDGHFLELQIPLDPTGKSIY